VAAAYAPLAVRKGAARYRAAGRPRRLTEDDFTEVNYMALVDFVARNTHADGTDRKGRNPITFEQHLKARLWDRGTNLVRHHSRHRRKLEDVWRSRRPDKHARGGRPEDVKKDFGYPETCEQRIRLTGREDQAPDNRLGAALARMRELDPGATDCFVLSRGHGLSYQEVAARLGLTVPQVKYRLKKADSLVRGIREQPQHAYQ
jgi:DNA-directed RNA polymerase specialized sigma24 family protein